VVDIHRESWVLFLYGEVFGCTAATVTPEFQEGESIDVCCNRQEWAGISSEGAV